MFGIPKDGKALILYPNAEFYDGMKSGNGVFYNLVNSFKYVTDWTNDKILDNIYKGDFLGIIYIN